MNDLAFYDDFDYETPWIRILQSSNSTTSNSTAATGGKQSESKILRDTFVIYGSAFLVLLFVFCILRRVFPRWYNLRSWVESIRTPLANEFFGFVSWIWMVLMVPEEDIFTECTFDFLVIQRILGMGFRISSVGMFTAIWLLPLYATAPVTASTANVTDPVVSITIANVPPGSSRLAAPALSSYVFFGYILYSIYHEFAWYTRKRHEFLMRTEARNYTVYVRNIPPEYRSNTRLMRFFRHIYSHATVVEVHFLIRLPSLSKLVARRDAVLAKLERAMVLRDVTGREPTHFSLSIRSREQLNSIDVFAQELADLNKEIKERIKSVHQEEMYPTRPLPPDPMGEDPDVAKVMECPETHSSLVHIPEYINETDSLLEADDEERIAARACSLLTGTVPLGSRNNSTISEDSFDLAASPVKSEQNVMPEQNGFDGDGRDNTEKTKRSRSNLGFVAATMKFGLNTVNTVASKATQGVNTVASTAVSTVATTATSAVSTVANTATSAVSTVANTAAQAAALLQSQDGEYDDAAFVVFSQLSAVHSTMQMLQHTEPFTMEVLEAPEPDDVFWPNIGRSHHDLSIGWLLSMAATSVLCIFWTVPVAFVASLNSVSALTNFLPFVGELVEAIPILEPILTLLAPLLVTVLTSLLPTILGFISMLEGPISGATLEASKFSKLATFSIVQTFFISAITKGAVEVASKITGEIQEIVESPLVLINMLATELSKNSTYFIQIIFVSTVTVSALELLRVTPLAFAGIRHFIGPRLTPREKKQAFLGIFRPLSLVTVFQQADFLSSVILLFMVLFVYSAIAPLVSFVAAFCFLWLKTVYTNQNMFVYPPEPDSGGKLWPKAISILLSCMIIAEVVILGILGLRQSLIAIPLMVPLIVVTALFYGYVKQQHFRVAANLTADACMRAEMKQGSNFDAGFAKGKYKQPALQHETLLPDLPDLDCELPECLREFEDNNV